MKIILCYCLPWGNYMSVALKIENKIESIPVLFDKIQQTLHIDLKYKKICLYKDGFKIRLVDNFPFSFYDFTEGCIIYIEKHYAKVGDDQLIPYSINKKKKKFIERKDTFQEIPRNFKENFFIEDDGNECYTSNNADFYISTTLQKLLKETRAYNLEKAILALEQFSNEIEKDNYIFFNKKMNLINEYDSDGLNALHIAIKLGYNNFVKEFLLRKADVNRVSLEDYTPLQIAIEYNNFDAMKMLVEIKNIRINKKTKLGTALHLACANNFIKAVDLLIENNCNPKGYLAHELSTDFYIQNTLKEYINSYSKQKEHINEIEESQPAIVIGWVTKLRKLLKTHVKRLLLLDPYNGRLIRYKKRENYPHYPNAILNFEDIQKIEKIKNPRFFFFSRNLSYFQIHLKKEVQVYCCNYESTVWKWISLITEAQQYFSEIKNTSNKPENLAVNPEYSLYTIKSEITELKDTPLLKEIFIDKRKANEFQIENKIDWEDLSVNEQALNLPKSLAPSSFLSKESSPSKQFVEKPLSPLSLKEETYIKLSDFEILKEIGSGAFGIVYLVKKTNTNEIFAMKVLFKSTLIIQKKLRYAVAEANILKMCNHPFVLKMYYAFQTPKNLFLVMDYCPGGDLLLNLMKKNKFSEKEAKFYVAELILAIEYLHNMQVLYRDLKPENIFLDAEGHIKLGDFGLSKENFSEQERSMSFVGSPAYLAPEIISQKGADYASDIYGIGVILFELIVGHLPFYDASFDRMYNKIQYEDPVFPKTVSEEAKNLIKSLMHKDPSKRKGVHDMAEIRNDPFFSGIDFELLYKKKYIPPSIVLDVDQKIQSLLKKHYVVRKFE